MQSVNWEHIVVCRPSPRPPPSASEAQTEEKSFQGPALKFLIQRRPHPERIAEVILNAVEVDLVSAVLETWPSTLASKLIGA